MKDKRKASYITIIISLSIVFSIVIYKNYTEFRNNKSLYDEPLIVAAESDAHIPFDKDYILNSDFSTHLPIVIIDTNGTDIPVNSIWDAEQNKMKAIEGLEPYVDGSISIIDNYGINHLQDEPANHSAVKIKRRGNSSMFYTKPQYMVKLVTESGQENALSLLEMGEDNEWILNGSMVDKSMMRNYLAYRIASQIMPYTPDSKYCEVVLKENGSYKYQGVYLLCESIKQGISRVDIGSYKASKTYCSYLLRRDRYDDENIMLDTYATRNKLSYGYLGLIYPGKNRITGESVEYIEEDIDRIEQILYSKSYRTFLTYPNYIDVDSFVDYFLLNEFFVSYDAGFNSTYMYKKLGGKLTMGPVWDFDQSMDNYSQSSARIDDLPFTKAPWFDRLKDDPGFVERMESRYAELRRNQLSDENISGTIDSIQAHLGGAQQREWARWTTVYLDRERLNSYVDEDGDGIRRETNEYQQEIYKLKTVLRKHGLGISRTLHQLREDFAGEKKDTKYSSNLFLSLFLGAFFTATIFSRRI